MSDESIMAAVEAFDLEDYLQDFGFRALRHNEWVGLCPYCGKEDKLAVNIEKKSFHCWVCQEFEDQWDSRTGSFKKRPVAGAGGLIALIQWLEEVDKEEAVQKILEGATIDLQKLVKPLEVKIQGDISSLDIASEIPPPEQWALITSPLPYMLKRGITMEDVATFGLFWCPEGRYRNRLIFPVWEHGRLVYWQGRAMFEKEDVGQSKFTKALNPPRTEGAKVSSEVLMNIDQASTFPRVAIVEGPMDVIRTGPDAVCTFGKQLHPRQVRLLRERGVRSVDLMWDGPTDREPDGAQIEMLELAPWLSQFFDTRLVFLPHGDPADWDRASLTQMRGFSEPFGADLGLL